VEKVVELLDHVVATQVKAQAEGHRDRLSVQHNLAIAYQAEE